VRGGWEGGVGGVEGRDTEGVYEGVLRVERVGGGRQWVDNLHWEKSMTVGWRETWASNSA